MNEDLFQLGIKAFIVNSEGHILLLKVNKEMLKGFSGDPYWDIPGGRVHRGSSVEETLRREVKEETGIDELKRISPFMMVVSNIRIPRDGTDTGLILSVHACKVEGPVEITLSNEHIEYRWFSPREASELLKVKYPKEFTDRIATFQK